MSDYAPLWCKSNFSFLEGASHAEELVEEAHRLGLRSIAITDRDGVYGMVRAHVKARELGVQLVCGAQVTVAASGNELVASPVSVAGLHGRESGSAGVEAARGRGPGWGADTDDLPSTIPTTGRRGRTKRAKPRQVALEPSPAGEGEAPPSSRIMLL